MIICFTPLQELIARKAITLGLVERGHCLLYFYIDKNTKVPSIEKSVESPYKACVILHLKGGIVRNSIRFIISLIRLSLDESNARPLVVSGVENFYIKLSMLICSSRPLETIDDGLGNLLETSGYNSEERFLRAHWSSPLLNRLFSLSLNSIKRKTRKHYTIFEFNDYIEDSKTTFIRLFDIRHNIVCAGKRSIFIGQPLQNMGLSGPSPEYSCLINSLCLDEYLIHHFERYSSFPYEKVKPILLSTIAEIYIGRLIEDGWHLTLYAFNSTVLATVNSPFVTKYCLNYDFPSSYILMPGLYQQAIAGQNYLIDHGFCKKWIKCV